MERWCQYLLPAVKSRMYPFVSLVMWQYHLAQFNEIQTCYDLFERLQLTPSRRSWDTMKSYMRNVCDHWFLHCSYLHLIDGIVTDPHSILWPPKRIGKPLEGWMQNLAASYFTTVFNIPISTAKQLLPKRFMAWGKVWIANGGDTMRVGSLPRNCSRDASFVWVRKIQGSCVRDRTYSC